MPAFGRGRRDASSCVTASYSDGWGTDPNYNARDAHCTFQVGDRSKDETDGARCQAKASATPTLQVDFGVLWTIVWCVFGLEAMGDVTTVARS